jgi:uncharacterized membrane protein YgcG
MWFRVFVLMRLPVSLFAMLGIYFSLLDLKMVLVEIGFLRAVAALALLAFVAVTSIKLYQLCRRGLQLACGLLALEVIGFGYLMYFADNFSGGVDIFWVLRSAVLFALVWTLPNAIVLYRARNNFIGPEVELLASAVPSPLINAASPELARARRKARSNETRSQVNEGREDRDYSYVNYSVIDSGSGSGFDVGDSGGSSGFDAGGCGGDSGGGCGGDS